MEQRRTQRRSQAGQRRPTLPRPERPGKAADVSNHEDRAAQRAGQRPRRREDRRAARTQAGDASLRGDSGRTQSRRPPGATALVRGRARAYGRGPLALLARLPRPKLTALGCGLVASAVMLLVGSLSAWLLNDGATAYGVCFLLLSAGCALWVRVADALTAPVALPIAFAIGLLPMGEGEGVGAWFVEFATTLAVNAGWLYSGTLLAGVIVVVRRGMLAARRRRDRRPAAQRA